MDPLYDQIVACVSAHCGVRTSAIKPETTLFGDLGIDGDDGFELLEGLARTFSVDMSGCDPNRYFGPEGLHLLVPVCWLVMLFRKGSPEQKARLQPITIADLVRSAELGRWAGR